MLTKKQLLYFHLTAGRILSEDPELRHTVMTTSTKFPKFPPGTRLSLSLQNSYNNSYKDISVNPSPISSLQCFPVHLIFSRPWNLLSAPLLRYVFLQIPRCWYVSASMRLCRHPRRALIFSFHWLLRELLEVHIIFILRAQRVLLLLRLFSQVIPSSPILMNGSISRCVPPLPRSLASRGRWRWQWSDIGRWLMIALESHSYQS